LAHDGNSSNDVKRPVECADASVLASLIALASPMVVDTNGIVRNETEATGIPLSALVLVISGDPYGHADIYGPYVNGSARLVFDPFINVSSAISNMTWQTPMFGRVRWHGPDSFEPYAPTDSGEEGVGPYWNAQIPPGEPYSHYNNETVYTKLMPNGISGIYHNELLIRRDFASIMKKYDLYNMNVTADQRVADYPAVPELKYFAVLPSILGYQFYRAKVWKRLRRRRQSYMHFKSPEKLVPHKYAVSTYIPTLTKTI